VRRSIGAIILGGLFAVSCGLSGADEPRNLPRIGQVFGSNPTASRPYDQAFRDGLGDLGYVDGKNVILVARYANGDSTRFPAILAELVALNVDMLVITPSAAHAAKAASSKIPIVLPSGGDFVKEGLVASLAHPGGNITGQTAAVADTEALELAIEAMPGLKRLGVMAEAYPEVDSRPQIVAERKAFEALARTHGVALHEYQIRTLDDVQSAIKKIASDRIQAVLLINSYLTIQHREPIIKGLAAERIPVESAGRDMAESGALLTYSPDFFDMWRRSSVYVDKILKGFKPGDLPIQQATKLQLIVNLKTAKALGVTIPESILVRADHVIQ
jgi:putative ABC transport system substrate-binding protein